MEEFLKSMPIFCNKDNVAKAAWKLSGCAGLYGVYGLILCVWILRQGLPPKKLCKELAILMMLLISKSPDYAYALYCALNASRVLLTDKNWEFNRWQQAKAERRFS